MAIRESRIVTLSIPSSKPGWWPRGLQRTIPIYPVQEAKAKAMLAQKVQVPISYIHSPQSRDRGSPLRRRYIPYSYMDPFGQSWSTCQSRLDSTQYDLHRSLLGPILLAFRHGFIVEPEDVACNNFDEPPPDWHKCYLSLNSTAVWICSGVSRILTVGSAGQSENFWGCGCHGCKGPRYATSKRASP